MLSLYAGSVPAIGTQGIIAGIVRSPATKRVGHTLWPIPIATERFRCQTRKLTWRSLTLRQGGVALVGRLRFFCRMDRQREVLGVHDGPDPDCDLLAASQLSGDSPRDYAYELCAFIRIPGSVRCWHSFGRALEDP